MAMMLYLTKKKNPITLYKGKKELANPFHSLGLDSLLILNAAVFVIFNENLQQA